MGMFKETCQTVQQCISQAWFIIRKIIGVKLNRNKIKYVIFFNQQGTSENKQSKPSIHTQNPEVTYLQQWHWQ